MNTRRLFLLLLSISILALPLRLAANTDLEAQLKAALIYRMGHYATWNNPPEFKNYCFVGDSVAAVRDILLAKYHQGKLAGNVVINTVNKLVDIERHECQILYVNDIEQDEWQRMKELSKSTLTISNDISHLPLGLIASIEIKNRKPQLTVSRGNLKRSNIKIDSRLLKVVKLSN